MAHMRFVFGFAGVPPEIYEAIERDNRRYAEGANFLIDKMPQWAPYEKRNVDTFVKRFGELAASGSEDQLSATGFAVIYLPRDNDSTARFVQEFFPHMLMIPVNWRLELNSSQLDYQRQKNELIPLLAQATSRARACLRALRDEVVCHATRTPVLLPVKNFSSGLLVPALAQLHVDLAEGNVEPGAAIRRRVDAFRASYPLKGPPKGRCYTDDKEIEFRPPGRDRHGYARAGGAHPDKCLLSGRRRLGAPYDRLFHYDCAKGSSGNLEASLHDCHSSASDWVGNPHINVAPNDNVRAKRA